MTIQLPIHLLRRLKEAATAEEISMNAYIERVLVKELGECRKKVQKAAAARLLTWAMNGLYEMFHPLSREEAHDRRI